MSILGRILTELLKNACKYTPLGEQITVTACAKAETIQISVTNSGIEIPASELPHVFEKFYRVPSADPWKQGGTGLGLSLAKKRTEYLGGRIWVESASGRTCFTVELAIS
jgi:signal transduction histidine kinase